MSEAIDQAKTNQEAVLLATAEAEQARLVSELWQHPQLADPEIPVAAKIPQSLWATCKAEGDTPPLYTIGRRLFCRTEDLRAWLDAKARDGKPGSRPRNGQRKA
jgi:hypothetical protein